MIDALIENAKEIINSEELYYIDKKHNYRYERKFTVPDKFTLKTIEQFVKRIKALFREVYHL